MNSETLQLLRYAEKGEQCPVKTTTAQNDDRPDGDLPALPSTPARSDGKPQQTTLLFGRRQPANHVH
jgi:hypothetical protein